MTINESPTPPASGSCAQTKPQHPIDSRGRLPQPGAPFSPAAKRAAQWLYRDALCELAALIESLASSCGEAAWRGQDGIVRAHLGDMRRVLVEAIDTLKRLETLGAKTDGTAGPA